METTDKITGVDYQDWITKKVFKKSGKPFKSRLKVNVVRNIRIHPKTNKLVFTFFQDNSFVECHMCELVSEAMTFDPKAFEDNLDKLIEYLDTTTPESWCLDVCGTEDHQFCLLGHVLIFGGNRFVDWFENRVATTFMFYPINDGTNKKYQQPTAKERCIAYIKDLRDGKEKTTKDHEEDYDKWRKEQVNQ